MRPKGLPGNDNEPLVYEIFVNEVTIKEYPNLVLPLTAHLRDETDPAQIPVVLK